MKVRPTLARVRELFDFDPATRTLRRKGTTLRPGWLNNGYQRVLVDNHAYYEAQLVWLLEAGEWPAARVTANSLRKRDAPDIRKLVSYDPETGHFHWLVSVGSGLGRRRPGDRAGSPTVHGKYRCITSDSRYFFEHVLAVYLMSGAWPSGEIDHINGDGTDNRWANLRPATRVGNAQNQRLRRNNRSGFKGVSWSNRRQAFIAQIVSNKRRVYLGQFASAQAAHSAYCAAGQQLHGDFFNDGHRCISSPDQDQPDWRGS